MSGTVIALPKRAKPRAKRRGPPPPARPLLQANPRHSTHRPSIEKHLNEFLCRLAPLCGLHGLTLPMLVCFYAGAASFANALKEDIGPLTVMDLDSEARRSLAWHAMAAMKAERERQT